MRIIQAHPPLFALIDQKFEVRGKPVIYCWGDTIFNPQGIKVPSYLVAHEEVHSERQGTGDAEITAWWMRYIEDQSFRLSEELPAHQAEYRAYRKRHGPGGRTVQYLNEVARKLSSPLYGSVIDYQQARTRILLPGSSYLNPKPSAAAPMVAAS